MNDNFTEILDLALELFEDTYGLDMETAFVQARALYPTFQAFAAEWDAESARIAAAEREAWYALVYEVAA